MILKIGGKVRNKTLLPQWECIATRMGVIGVFRMLIAPCVGVCRISRISLQALQGGDLHPFSENTLFYLYCGRP